MLLFLTMCFCRDILTAPVFIIQIYYEDHVVKTAKETYVYDTGSLIGDVGGYLGLFLGASTLSLYQMGQNFMVRVGSSM